MSTSPLFFDIETGPLSLDVIKQVTRPFKSKLKHPGEFDPQSVKYGNTKDEGLRAKKLEECMKKHADEVANFESKLAKEEQDYWDGIVESAALSALTGCVLAIGYGSDAGETVDHIQAADGNEASLLDRFWTKFVKCKNQRRKIVGFNIKQFDVPFLVQRSCMLRVDLPEGVMEGRYLSNTFVDLNDLWMAGSRGTNGNLDEISRACNVGQKPDGVSGALFYELYSDESTRQKALDYAINDVVITRGIAIRLGM